ncbi:MAG: helix-turn-helix domain-containing protein [Lachnospiraceae bacterium]
MTTQELGELLVYSREKKQISREVLCKGICTVARLKSLEYGEHLLDYMSMERLLTRLGIAPMKLELVMTEEDYETYEKQIQLEAALEEQEYPKAEQFLKEYGEKTEPGNLLHQQQVMRVQGILLAEYYKEHRLSADWLKKALQQTLPGFEIERIEEYLLSEEELLLVLYEREQYWKAYANRTTLLEDYEQIKAYVDGHYDKELQLELYPKLTELFTDKLLEQGALEQAAQLNEKNIDLQGSVGKLTYLPRSWQLYKKCLRLQGDQQKETEIDKQYEALQWVYEQHDVPFPDAKILLWKREERRDITLQTEFLRQERNVRGVSQEQMAIRLDLDHKTISRLETGKHVPKKGTMQKLKDYLQINRERYQPMLAVRSAELLELQQNINATLARENILEAEMYLEELKEKMTEVEKQKEENAQYLLFTDTIIRQRKKELSADEVLERLEEAFEMTTYGKYDIFDLSKSNLRQQEVNIVNSIAAILCEEKGELEKSILIWEGIIKKNRNSRLPLEQQFYSSTIVLSNLVVAYGKGGEISKAWKCADECIKIELCNKNGRSIGYNLINMASLLQLQKKDVNREKKYYRIAYRVLEMTKDVIRMKMLKRFFQDKYHEQID